CIGGHKYFYIDWNLDIWRCEAWTHPMGSVFDLDALEDQRDACNACTMSCYRHARAMMHGAIAVTDSAQAFARGGVPHAISALFQRGVAQSLWTLIVERWPRSTLISPRRRGSRVQGHGESHRPRIL